MAMMKLPVIQGVIDRRMLVNFRVDPEVLQGLLPSPFKPQLVKGFAIAGICLIRLKHIRPKGLPAWMGLGSENAAHRFAVEWQQDGQTHTGVYIPRRDTNSCLNSLLGGRLFPGEHHHAHFQIRESHNHYELAFESDDGSTSIDVATTLTDKMPGDSVFDSLEQASQFFEKGSLGYSPRQGSDWHDGLALQCKTWTTQSLDIERVASSYFNDSKIFPEGSVAFDHALLMRHIEHEWHRSEMMCCDARP